MDSQSPEFTTIDEYLSLQTAQARDLLAELRALVRSVVPGAVERIAYRMPSFEQGGPLVYFAAFKKHIGLFPTSGPIAAFEDELAGYVHAKGSIQFPFSEPMPWDLIRRIIEYRRDELAALPPKKKKGTKAT